MSAALDYTYRYGFPSGVAATATGRPQLSLATCNADQQRPYFFDGRARYPRMLGDMLYTLSDVVRTHFFLPRPVILDPVLTSNEELLRLEGFSGCCGVYARVDLPAEAFDGDCHGRGTTNVDFNQPMRNALLRLRDEEDVRFAVGADEVMLSKGDERTIEKKVKLPLRWIKGFSEVQAYQPRLQLMMEVNAAEALRFVRTLPKGAKPKMPSYAVSAGRSIRLSQRAQKGAVPILGTHRVKVIEPLLVRARSLRVWCDEASGASAWEVRYPIGAFFLMISPEVFRGFSGEGQILSVLAKPPEDAVIAKVRASLRWQSQVDVGDLATGLNLKSAEVETALAVLGSKGLAGFDADTQRYFHRVLPFDLDKVEDMQPRLGNARKLVEGGLVRRLPDAAGGIATFEVQGTGTMHRVGIAGDHQSCTCPWFSKYQGQRGPCKHILAASIVVEAGEAAA
ncbi:SWIM zinc finger family protein [Sphingomonas sp. ASY06-1R]|uniref:SWIM zinc finger family protein n=1 Tax=Sphingomonas sp. ASY06-1R TaxID=3445771 RepID=UPI003FA2719D